MKLFVKLQTPTIELKVTAKDAAGTKDSIIVGFKRYELTETETKLKQLQQIMQEAMEDENIAKNNIDKFVKDEVVYIKQANLQLADEKGNPKDLNIADTRTAKPIETLWESADECLVVLLDLYLQSAPYRVSLITSLQKALLNNDYSEAEVKN